MDTILSEVLVIHSKRPRLTVALQQSAAMTWSNAQHLRSLSRAQVVIDDILKDFEAVDFFHGEHPGVRCSHRKLIIRKSESLTKHAGLKTIPRTFLMSHK